MKTAVLTGIGIAMFGLAVLAFFASATPATADPMNCWNEGMSAVQELPRVECGVVGAYGFRSTRVYL